MVTKDEKIEKLGKGHFKRKWRNIILLNVMVVAVAIMASVLAFYVLPETTQIKVIFIIQSFAGASNLAIWIISIYMWGQGQDMKQYVNKQVDVIDDIFEDVVEFQETLSSDGAEDFKEMLNEVDWNEVKKALERVSREEDDIDEGLEDVLGED